jgi:hypothetical protein
MTITYEEIQAQEIGEQTRFNGYVTMHRVPGGVLYYIGGNSPKFVSLTQLLKGI